MVNNFADDKCTRIVRQSQYERQSPETFNWWLKLFQMMENEFLIPPHKRKEVVKEIFPTKVFEKIVSLITLVEGDLVEHKGPVSSSSLRSSKSGAVTVSTASVERNVVVKKEKVTEPIDKREAGPNNPYIRFFKRNPERAAIWRDLPPLSLDEMSLTQKAEAITEAIAVDFINWIQKLGGETPTTLDVAQVMKMFEVGFNTHAATSLQAMVKEMPAVTKHVAESRGLRERTTQNTLHRKMREDIKSFGRQPKMFAFGTTLPHEMRVSPPKVDPTKRWTTARTNLRLKSMAAVWDGITDLRSTRAYCKWLITRPDIPAPEYLEKLGMITPSYFDQPHYSIDTQDSTDEGYMITSVGPGILTQTTQTAQTAETAQTEE